MADVAQDLGVDAIGLNHLMYSTPEEVAETLRILDVVDPALIATYVTRDTGVTPARARTQVTALQEQCRERGIKFDFRPRVWPEIVDGYYTPGTPLAGRCLYPFRHARVGFSGKVYFCPFIRVEVGDLATETLEQVWTSERYAAMRRKLLEHRLFPVCRRCCKVELERPSA
jgi:MoaA/NifB/PqqE/SkfB family radical SAM enzyme